MKLVFIFLFGCASAANILIMLPTPMYSHTTNYLTVFKELAKRGHNVTCVSPYPQKLKSKNWNDIIVRTISQDVLARMGNINLTDTSGMMYDLSGTWWFSLILFELMVQEEPVQRVIKDTSSSYDLIITETFFAHEPFLALGHKFNAPVISISAAGIIPIIAHYTGNDFPSAYLPNRKLMIDDKMTFLERVKNTFYTFWEIYVAKLYYIPKMDSLMRKHIVYQGSENLPYLSDLLSNSSLVLVESHLGLHYPRPLHRNIIEVGGINLKDGDQYPEDLKAIMDTPHGFIYFSLGSAFNFTNLDESKQNEIISAFAKFKQKVLMKYEGNVMPKRPKNVHIRKWLPQATILGHPNCKFFVTHAGLHGIMESLYQGVPLVAIPLFSDQRFNAKFIETIGAGEQIQLKELTERKLFDAMNKVLSEKSYKETAELRKRILRDNPISQLDNAIYWIEYVIRFKGAPHLRPASVDLPWYQRHLCDVSLFFTALTVLFITSIIIFVKLIKLLCCCKKVVKAQANKKKQ